MPRRGEVPGNEGVTHAIDGADLAVDAQVPQDHLVAALAVAVEQRLDGVVHGVARRAGDPEDTLAELRGVRLQAGFVVRHDDQPPGRASGATTS